MARTSDPVKPDPVKMTGKIEIFGRDGKRIKQIDANENSATEVDEHSNLLVYGSESQGIVHSAQWSSAWIIKETADGKESSETYIRNDDPEWNEVWHPES